MNRCLVCDEIRTLLMEDNSFDEEKIGGKEDDNEKNIINKGDRDTDSEIEINKKDEHSHLDVDSKSFEDHDNDDKYFMKTALQMMSEQRRI